LIDLDLDHLGLPGAICAYVIPGVEPAIVDPGPSTTIPTLERKLAERGIALSDIRHVLLTHVHLDHAGAAGHLAARSPKLQVHVHVEGAPHIADPERLVASTRRTFGEAHDRLWGEMRPVPADRVKAWEPGRGPLAGSATSPTLKRLRPLSTPGHIGHHVAYLDESEGVLFAGDSMGIILSPDGPTHPPTPPPAIDLEAWQKTLDMLAGVRPDAVAPTHFGVHKDFEDRRQQLSERLRALESRVEAALAQGNESDPLDYEEEVRAEQAAFRARELVDRYFDVFPAATDWAGVKRWVEKTRRKAAG
jgi:glyoxylase-like metal-dependent hydrolase (beta-lactamase superfamily II)